ncbi:methyltransferase domain-containing protein [Marinilabiliaceae bacterium JC017]|nr:methyltransferase domain-containing protein [Marinilabiliaceae bacterium JC017]
MAFYNSIADVYDQLFPLNMGQVEFIEKSFPGVLSGVRLIDAGCGTGSLAIMLARRGANVAAFDGDDGMIEKARMKQPQALNLRFSTGDLITKFTDFNAGAFDGVLCFGNTLVHLINHAAISGFIGAAAGALKQGGKLWLQIVNYDRVVKEQADSLPTINAGGYGFERKYDYRPDGLIDFNTRLIEAQSGEVIENSVPLLPLRKEELVALLQPYFSQIAVFGDFKRTPWSDTSFHLVVEAMK